MLKNNRLFYLLLSTGIILSVIVAFIPQLFSRNLPLPEYKNYTDSEFGYSVSVPHNWQVNSISNPVQFFEVPSSPGIRILRMEIFSTPLNQDLAEYIADLEATSASQIRQLESNNQPVFEEKLQTEYGEYYSYYFQHPKISNMFITTFNKDLNSNQELLQDIVSSFKFVEPKIAPTISLPSSIAPSSQNFTCPESGWIDCMPQVGYQKVECSQDFLDWATQNCSNFQGVAY